MHNTRFDPEYEVWAEQILKESVECLKDGLHPLPLHEEGDILILNDGKKVHAVLSIVRYLELCDSKLHNALRQNKSQIREYIRRLFIQDRVAPRLKEEQGLLINFLYWLTPLAVDTDPQCKLF